MVLSPSRSSAAWSRCPTCRGRSSSSAPGGRPSIRRWRSSWRRGASGFSLLCGRYEGVDQRVADHLVDGELSVGDFVLAGGELAALVVVEAVARLLPGVLGNEESARDESFTGGCSSTPSTPGRRNSGDGPSPRCSDRGTTGRWPPGVGRRPCCGRPNAAPI